MIKVFSTREKNKLINKNQRLVWNCNFCWLYCQNACHRIIIMIFQKFLNRNEAEWMVYERFTHDFNSFRPQWLRACQMQYIWSGLCLLALSVSNEELLLRRRITFFSLILVFLFVCWLNGMICKHKWFRFSFSISVFQLVLYAAGHLRFSHWQIMLN